MYRHHLRVPLHVALLVTSNRAVPQEELRTLALERLAAWRREQLRWDPDSGLRRLNHSLNGPATLAHGEVAALHADDEAFNLVIDQRPILLSQASDEDPAYADQVEHLRCGFCGSQDVEDARWHDGATGELLDSESPIGDEVYCRHCETQTAAEHGSLAEWRRTHPSAGE